MPDNKDSAGSPADPERKSGGIPMHKAPERATTVFIIAGLEFLLMALGLFGLGGFSLCRLVEMGPIIEIPVGAAGGVDLTSRDIYNFYGRVSGFFLGPVLLFIAAFVCTFVGIRLLRSAGAVTQEVIPTRDYELIAPAIRDGNEKAISEYIRLRSLSGMTGTFTKSRAYGFAARDDRIDAVSCYYWRFQRKLF